MRPVNILSKALFMPITLILMGVFIIIMLYRYLKKNTPMLTTPSTSKASSTSSHGIVGDAANGFKKVAEMYGFAFARQLEKMFRHETAHFKSKQWINTGTPGMEARTTVFPYGWSSLKNFADKKGLDADDFFIKYYKDNHTRINTPFIGFKNTGLTVEFVADFIHNVRGGDIVSWFRLPSAKTAQSRARYQKSLDSIQTKFV